MNLPSIEPIPPEDSQGLPPARRRRSQRAVILPDGSNRAAFLNMLSQRVVPSFDFFLFSLLSGLVLAGGLLAESPALIFLAALLAPFMAPVVGIALGTITGSGRFLFQTLASLLVGSLMVFICGALSGWMMLFLPISSHIQAATYARFDWSSFLVISLGVGLTTYLVVQSPEKRPLVSSAAIAYGLYLPAGAAGFGLSTGQPQIWQGALGLFGLYLIWSTLLGCLMLVILGLRPLNASGYLLTGLYATLTALAILAAVLSDQPPAQGEIISPGNTSQPAGELGSYPTAPETQQVQTPSAITILEPDGPTKSPTPSQTPVPPSITPTRTLVPSNTPTLTITPMPTPVWARISAKEGGGALIREEPDYNATVVQSLLNGNLVEVLPEVSNSGGVTWVHVRTVNGKEGWVVRSLLTTATPAPNW